MKSYKEHLETLPIEMKEYVAEHGVMRFTTCDTPYYGWDQDKHNAMMQLRRKGVEGLHISGVLKFECWDWTITEA